MIKGKRKSKFGEGKVDVPLSSMIDVVFLLLIYFIVNQKPMVEETLLGVDLPSASASSKARHAQIFTIDVMKVPGDDKDNVYYLNGRPWTFDELLPVMCETAKADPDITVIINCGPNARHKKLIKILDACSKAGLTKLNLMNDESIRFVPDGQAAQ